MPQSGEEGSTAAFGSLIAAFERGSGGSGTTNVFPQGDADDLCSGATYIPPEVTEARQRGEEVTFVTGKGSPYWRMPDGSLIYH